MILRQFSRLVFKSGWNTKIYSLNSFHPQHNPYGWLSRHPLTEISLTLYISNKYHLTWSGKNCTSYSSLLNIYQRSNPWPDFQSIYLLGSKFQYWQAAGLLFKETFYYLQLAKTRAMPTSNNCHWGSSCLAKS